MNVLFITRSTLFTNKGGDTIQVTNTSKYLNRLNIKTEIRLCHEKIDYRSFDLIHFFNIIRPADILHHIHVSKKPFVISPIFVDYGEYEKQVRKGFVGKLFRFLSPDWIEYIKVLGRAMLSREKIVSRSYLWLGQNRAVKKIINQANLLLPNSESEYQRLLSRYRVPKEYCVIPNAIDPGIFVLKAHKPPRDKDLVLCVARIEGIKNQLNLIKALNNTEYKLVLIGKASTNQMGYFKACRDIAATNITFIDYMPQQQLTDYYAKASIHVLPSWFETTGLSSLEAASMGCKIVVSDKGDTREYFEEMAFYCDPSSPSSILETVKKATAQPYNESLRRKIFDQYTWPNAAQKTLQAYKKVIPE